MILEAVPVPLSLAQPTWQTVMNRMPGNYAEALPRSQADMHSEGVTPYFCDAASRMALTKGASSR